MKFRATKDELARALALARSGAAHGAAQPELLQVLLRVDASGVYACGTDLATAIQVRLDAEPLGEGECLIDPRAASVVAELPVEVWEVEGSGPDSALAGSGGGVSTRQAFTVERKEYHWRDVIDKNGQKTGERERYAKTVIIDFKRYPVEMTRLAFAGPTCTVVAADLGRAVRRVLPACHPATKSFGSLPVEGVHLAASAHRLDVYATDTHILAWHPIETLDGGVAAETLAADFAALVAEACVEGTAEVRLEPGRAKVRVGGTTIAGRVMAGRYPPAASVFARPTTTVPVILADLQRSLRLAEVARPEADTKNQVVWLAFEDGRVTVRSRGHGYAEWGLPAGNGLAAERPYYLKQLSRVILPLPPECRADVGIAGNRSHLAITADGSRYLIESIQDDVAGTVARPMEVPDAA